MISQSERDSIRQEMLQEQKEDELYERKLRDDEEFALEQIVDDDLLDIHSRLAVLSEDMRQYGWDTTVSELIERLKDF